MDTEAGAAVGPPFGLAARARDLLLASAIAFAALWLSGCVQPSLRVPSAGDGACYAAMAAQPFAFAGDFPHRILGPLLAHALGLAGDRYWLFSWGCNWLLLAVVFDCARAGGARPAGASLATLAVALSGAVQAYKLMIGYSDTLSFALLLLAYRLRARSAAVWCLVLANAFAHEMVFFFAPWLFYQRLRAGGRWWREAAALGVAAGVYEAWRLFVAWRLSVAAHAPVRDANAYFATMYLPWGTLALWVALLLLWLVEFGPLLAVVAWAMRAGLQGHGRFGPALYFGGLLSTMAFAHDVQRFDNFLFLPLLLASLPFLAGARGRAVYAALLLATAVCYAALHPQTPGAAPGGRLLACVNDGLLRSGAYDAYAKKEYAGMFALAASALWPLLLGGAAAYALLWWAGGRLRKAVAG